MTSMQPQTQYVPQPQPQPAMQPQQLVTFQAVPDSGPRSTPNFPSKITIVFSGIQLGIGLLCLALNSIAIGMSGHVYYFYGVSSVGAGIWCGILFMVTGALGFATAKAKTKGLITSFMVMCIISAVFTVPIFTVSGIAVSTGYYYVRMQWITGIYGTMLFLALVELVIAIIASTMCCDTLCGCCARPTAGAIQYANQYNAVGYAPKGAPGLTYYTPQPVAYVMQPNTEMLNQVHGLPVVATEPIAVGQGHQPIAPGMAGNQSIGHGPATFTRAGDNTMPLSSNGNIPGKL